MKRYIKSKINEEPSVIKKYFEILVNIDVEVVEEAQEHIAAATHKGFNVPEGQLLPAEKDALIEFQALQDYNAFIESVEGLLTDYYGLHVYYKNESPDHSFYYGMLAKNDDETFILEFEFKLRVSTHPAHRSSQSTTHKKEQRAKLREIIDGRKIRPIFRNIVVNRDTFDTYMDAYLGVDAQIQEVVEKLERKKS